MEQAELDAKMKEWQCKIEQLHKDMSGVHTSSKHTTNTDKTVRVRENRLDQVMWLKLSCFSYYCFLNIVTVF